MKQTDIETMIAGTMQKDEQSYHDLYIHSFDRVYYLALKIMQNDSDAQDIAQEVLLTVYEKLPELQVASAYYRWLNRITANKCVDLLRKRNRLPAVEESEEVLGNLIDENVLNNPEMFSDDVETRRMIREIIDGLKGHYRFCIYCYYYQDMSVKDIAEALGVTENVVKGRLAVGRKKIREAMEGLERQQGIKLYNISAFGILLKAVTELTNTVQNTAEQMWSSARAAFRQGNSTVSSTQGNSVSCEAGANPPVEVGGEGPRTTTPEHNGGQMTNPEPIQEAFSATYPVPASEEIPSTAGEYYEAANPVDGGMAGEGVSNAGEALPADTGTSPNLWHALQEATPDTGSRLLNEGANGPMSQITGNSLPNSVARRWAEEAMRAPGKPSIRAGKSHSRHFEHRPGSRNGYDHGRGPGQPGEKGWENEQEQKPGGESPIVEERVFTWPEREEHTDEEVEAPSEESQNDIGNNSGASQSGRRRGGGGGEPYRGRSYIPIPDEDLYRRPPPGGDSGGATQNNRPQQNNRNNQQQNSRRRRRQNSKLNHEPILIGTPENRWTYEELPPVEPYDPSLSDVGTYTVENLRKSRRPKIPLIPAGIGLLLGMGILIVLLGRGEGGGTGRGNSTFHYNSTEVSVERNGVMLPQGLLYNFNGSTYLETDSGMEKIEMNGDAVDFNGIRSTPLVVGKYYYYVYKGVIVKRSISDFSTRETTPENGPEIDFIFYDGKTMYALWCKEERGYIVDPNSLDLEEFAFPYANTIMASTMESRVPEIFLRDGIFYYYRKYSDDGETGQLGIWKFDPVTGENTPILVIADGYSGFREFSMDQEGNLYFVGHQPGVDNRNWEKPDSYIFLYAVYKIPAGGSEPTKFFDIREHPYFQENMSNISLYYDSPYGLRVYGDYLYFVMASDDQPYEFFRMRLDGSGLQAIRPFGRSMEDNRWMMVGDYLITAGNTFTIAKMQGDAFVLELDFRGGRSEIDKKWEVVPQ